MERLINLAPTFIDNLGSLSLKNKLRNEDKHYIEVGKMSCSFFHDILNPITGLLLYLETVDQKFPTEIIGPAKESSKQIKEFIQVIQKSFHQEDEIKNIDLNEVTKNSLKIMRYKSLQNKVSMVFIEKDQIYIKTNEAKIYQIMINLISNAIDSYDEICDGRKKYVSIILESDENIRIKVQDNGIGIKTENIKSIFNKLYTTKTHGTGIGLSHTKDIIEKDLQGEIKIESEYQKGTLFEVSIKNH